jgi:lactate permease
MPWIQVYDPLHSVWLSTLIAAIPIVVLLGTLALLEWRAYWSAAAGLGTALVVSIAVFGMPVSAALAAAANARRTACCPSAGSSSPRCSSTTSR